MTIRLPSLVFSRPLLLSYFILFLFFTFQETGIIRARQTIFASSLATVVQHKSAYLKVDFINLVLSHFNQFHIKLNYYNYFYLITHPQYLTSRDTLLERSSRIKRTTVDNSEGFCICYINVPWISKINNSTSAYATSVSSYFGHFNRWQNLWKRQSVLFNVMQQMRKLQAGFKGFQHLLNCQCCYFNCPLSFLCDSPFSFKLDFRRCF